MRVRRLLLVVATTCAILPGQVAVAARPVTVPPAPPGEALNWDEWTGLRHRIVGGPSWLAADDVAVYVRRDSGDIDVLDPDSGATTSTFDIEGNASGHLCQGVGAGPTGVWSCLKTDVVRVDPVSGAIGTPLGITKAAEQGHLPTGFDRVWVLTGDGSSLAAVDAATESVLEIALDARCMDVAVDDSSVWVSCALDDVVLRVDPASGEVVDRIEVVEPRGVAFSAGAVWVGGAGAVVRLDAETLDEVATIDGGVGRVGAIAAGDDGVWVRRAGAPLVRIDPATNEVTDELELGVPSGGDVLVAHGAVWATAYDDAALFRIDLP